jgi:hypothetical protein
MASTRFQQFMERHRTRITNMGSFPRTDRNSQSGRTTPVSSLYSVSTSEQQQRNNNSNITTTTTINGEQRKCWICFGSDEQADTDVTMPRSTRGDTTVHDRWVKACPCSLISHESCLLRWITENQKDMPFKKVGIDYKRMNSCIHVICIYIGSLSTVQGYLPINGIKIYFVSNHVTMRYSYTFYHSIYMWYWSWLLSFSDMHYIWVMIIMIMKILVYT